MDRGAVLNRALAAFDGNQTRLAKALGVKGPTVNRWFLGKSGIDFESCLRLAQVTGISAADVLAAAGHDPSLLPMALNEKQVAETDATEDRIRARMRDFESIVASYPKMVRLAVIEANIKMAQLFRDMSASPEPPVSVPEHPPVSAPGAPPTRRPRRNKGGLTDRQAGSAPPFSARTHVPLIRVRPLTTQVAGL